MTPIVIMNLKSGDERGRYKKLIEISISGHVSP